MKFKIIALGFISTLCISLPAHAQFGGMSVPGMGGGSSGPAVNADELKKTVTNALVALAYANSKYAKAVGNDSAASQLSEIGDKLKSGSLGVNADSISQLKTASENVTGEIKKRNDEKTKLSAEAKAAASEGVKFHVDGTLEGFKGAKQLKKAIESKSPALIASLSSLKDVPIFLGEWAKATTTIFSYLGSNGIDIKDADASIKTAMSDG